jgi:hypothetical protein
MKPTKQALLNCILGFTSLATVVSCNTTNFNEWDDPMQNNQGNTTGMSSGSSQDDGEAPTFDSTIKTWSGETATDAAADVVGSDADFYYEANKFAKTITVTYNGDKATVESNSSDVLVHQDGAYVTLDMATNAVSGVEVIASGTSSNGGLKIYGTKKFKLTLNGVDLTSQKGPAINSQCHKRMFVHLANGTTNKITDCATYTDDSYYLESTDEDRKGCMFSEGNLIFSGTGSLIVAGKYKHGIATDGYFWMRPGVTIVVQEAAKNGIQVKGDTDDGIGVTIKGGFIYANISSVAGKAIKTDLDANIDGGTLQLNTSGAATFDTDENDTSSAAGIKADGNINISAGTLTLKSTGTGGKGLNADGEINVSGGETTITTTGGKYTYNRNYTSSPKGAKADGNVNISGGKLNISVTGKSDGSEGLESKKIMTISGGEVYSYAYDDAINASSAINVTGGKVFAYAQNNDGIDSNGSLAISGGVVIGCGTSSPECGIDVDNSNNFKINGGTVIAIAGGSLQSKPSSASTQCCVEYGGLSANKDTYVTVLNSSSKPLLTFKLPKSLSSGSFFFSCSGLAKSSSYTIASGGTLSSYTQAWNGWYDGGTWSNGSTVSTFSISSTITSLGTSTSGMGGGGGQGGGWGGWGW